jgi:hypothetical protein
MKVSPALLGIGLVAVSGLAFHFWQRLGEERQQIASLALMVPERQTPTAVSPIPTPEQTSIVAEPPVQASTESQLSANPDRSALLPKRIDIAKMQMESPEGMVLRRSRMRLSQETVFPDVDQALALTKEGADKLLDLLTNQRMRSGSQSNNEPESPQDRAARQQKERETENAELQALLGSKYSKWQDYRENLSAWRQRSDLRIVLDAAGVPLTKTQDAALINVISAEQRTIKQTGASTTQGSSNRSFAEFTPENRQRLLDAAAPYLSPQQLDGYKGLLERKAAQEQMAQRAAAGQWP